MAKALVGHLGSGTDLRLAAEVRRLRHQVAGLEAELARLQALNEDLVGAVLVDDDLRLLTMDERYADSALTT